ANPENTRDRAYVALAEAKFPFTLPFNQPVSSTRLTFEQMGTSRHEVMTAFRRDGGEAADRALDAEALTLTDTEFAVLTGERFDRTAAAAPVSEYSGFEGPAPPTDTAWVSGAPPAGAVQHVDGDAWSFAAFDPPPPSGATAHASTVAAGF